MRCGAAITKEYPGTSSTHYWPHCNTPRTVDQRGCTWVRPHPVWSNVVARLSGVIAAFVNSRALREAAKDSFSASESERKNISIYIYIYIHIHIHIRIHLHIQITDYRLHIAYTYTYIHIHIHIHTYTCTIIHVHVYIYIYICTNTNIIIYTHIITY